MLSTPTRVSGRSGGCVGVVAIFSKTSSPLINLPNVVYLPSKNVGSPWQMKNWLPAESGSFERAIEITPRTCERELNSALMELRSRRSRPWQDDDEDALDSIATPDTAGRAVLGRDLERAVASLPPRARAVLVLHDVEGWKHEEIAGELGMAVGSSKAQLHRARGLLRARIGEQL